MMNNNSTTNSEKKPIIDNDEALRLIDLLTSSLKKHVFSN